MRDDPDKAESEFRAASRQLSGSLDALEQRLVQLDITPAPWEGVQVIHEIERDFAALRPLYATCNEGAALLAAGAPLRAGAPNWQRLTTDLIVSSTAAQLGASAIQRRWHDVDAAIDRSLSRAYALLGVYLGAVSLILGVISIWLALK